MLTLTSPLSNFGETLKELKTSRCHGPLSIRKYRIFNLFLRVSQTRDRVNFSKKWWRSNRTLCGTIRLERKSLSKKRRDSQLRSRETKSGKLKSWVFSRKTRIFRSKKAEKLKESTAKWSRHKRRRISHSEKVWSTNSGKLSTTTKKFVTVFQSTLTASFQYASTLRLRRMRWETAI